MSAEVSETLVVTMEADAELVVVNEVSETLIITTAIESELET